MTIGTRVATRPASRTTGIVVAIISAAAYGTSGSLAHPLLDLGWSSAAVTLLRLGGAGLVLAIPAALALRGWRPSRSGLLRLIAYGLTAAGGAQLCYFNAIRYLPVGTASLLEFTAPIWLLGYGWIRHARRPSAGLLISAALALIGLLLVLDLVGGSVAGILDPRGLAWGFGSAFCLCAYFLLSDDHADAPPPVLMAGAGMLIGAAMVAVVGLIGILPLTAAPGRVQIGSAEVGWQVAGGLVILVPTVFAYVAGIFAVRRLGSGPASFVALAEVIFAGLFGAVLLAQWPSPVQVLGMALVVTGIVIAQRHQTAEPSC